MKIRDGFGTVYEVEKLAEFTHFGFTFFAHVSMNLFDDDFVPPFTVSEATTGARVAGGDTVDGAIQAAKDRLDHFGEKTTAGAIARTIEEFGRLN
ncbi:MAG: hypothetical protein ACYDH3_00085 [Candidatus Aminicenantales bacterium]